MARQVYRATDHKLEIVELSAVVGFRVSEHTTTITLETGQWRRNDDKTFTFWRVEDSPYARAN